MHPITHDEDLALKQTIVLPQEQKPRFPSNENLLEIEQQLKSLEASILQDHAERMLQIEDLSLLIEQALIDLLLARKVRQEEIVAVQNQLFLRDVLTTVVANLQEAKQQQGELKLSEDDLFSLAEKALIYQDAHDVARSLSFRRSILAQQSEESVSDEELNQEVRLIRRNGNVVPWSEGKVENAVRRAFLAIHQNPEPATEVARGVTARVKDFGSAYIGIEDVQDLVQEELMRQQHFKVATAYIRYRDARANARTVDAISSESSLNEIDQDSMIVVESADGETRFWDGRELRARIAFALIGLDVDLSKEQIELELRRSLSPQMTEDALRKTIILNARTLISKDADFAKFAGRILLSYIYEESLEWSIERDGIAALRDAHKMQFKKYLRHGIGISRLSPKLLEYDIEQLEQAIDPSADLEFDYLGIQTLYDRYLIVDKVSQKKEKRCIEPPQFFWMRVAMGLFHQEQQDRESWVVRLYQLYKGRRFCSSTPTLFNSGTLRSQLSSCYLYKVDDSIESIMNRGIAENAFLSKWAGGLGGSWTSVRGTGSYINGTNGESQGVIPFLKLHNDQLVAVNQGGKRRGSGCAYLETWHSDIEDFLELRIEQGDERRRTHDMNTANWVPDLFMRRMESRQDWTLFRSSEVADLHELYGKAFETRYIEYEKQAQAGEIFSKTIPAIDLWKKMLKMLFETGHPWITFKDPCNVRSPQDHAGVVHSSNLCTEITLNTSADETAVCNLGSVVLDNHLQENGELDLELLRETVHIAVRALDNVIDINFYPTEAAKRSNLRHRPIGLGVMGLHNALHKRKTPFSSQAAVEFNDEFMEAIACFAYEASSDLAKERGCYESYEGSKWDRGILPQDSIDLLEQERGEKVDVPRGSVRTDEKLNWQNVRDKIAAQGMRNSNVLAIAPTATISNIMGTTPCIEPLYKNLYVKENLGGKFMILNRNLVRDLKAVGCWTEELSEQFRYWDGDLSRIDNIPEELKQLHATVFDVPYEFIIDAAARRQKWIDQSQSVNLFLANPDIKTLSHMYRRAWRVGLKTTYYLRTTQASSIEKSSSLRTKSAKPSNTPAEISPAEKQRICSINAMLNGEECESCQ